MFIIQFKYDGLACFGSFFAFFSPGKNSMPVPYLDKDKFWKNIDKCVKGDMWNMLLLYLHLSNWCLANL